jgi:hypothetical protein
MIDYSNPYYVLLWIYIMFFDVLCKQTMWIIWTLYVWNMNSNIWIEIETEKEIWDIVKLR